MSCYKISFHGWGVLRVIFVLAGSFQLISGILSYLIHPYWIGLGVFVGIMQIVFAITGYCPSVCILRKIGFSSIVSD